MEKERIIEELERLLKNHDLTTLRKMLSDIQPVDLADIFEQVPEELYKAAKVDGTSDLKYLWKVMIPICQPTIVTITILKIIECWNSYVWPRLITDDASYFLVSNGIQELRENGFGRENIPAMMAAVVAISIPLILLFLIFHRKIMEGVSQGGIKG